MVTVTHTEVDQISLRRSVTKQTSWRKIQGAILSGNSDKSLTIGDIITITLKNGKQMRVAVAGINTYEENEAVFAFKDILSKEVPMNKESTNEGGYEASDMAKYLDTVVFELLPNDLQEVIKERRGHMLWLFSNREVFGEDGRYICPDADIQLPYYKDIENRIKLRDGRAGTPDWWWLASPSAASTAGFACVDCVGDSGDIVANSSIGMAPGFLV